jgi:pimeloyl-ACP methyl ester carboxylesterase
MSTFVLVHGSWFGSWSWAKVTPFLERAGHRVVVPSLPSFGGDPTPVASVTFDDAVACVEAAVVSADEPVVLVGHSRGGMLVSAVAERVPDRVAKAVYLAAYLAEPGQTLFEAAGSDTETLIMGVVAIDEGGFTTLSGSPAQLREALMADVSDADLEWATALLDAEPLSLGTTGVATTAERFGSVAKAFVVTTDDRAMGPALQRRQAEAGGVTETYELVASHSPFFSVPAELAEVLQRAAAAA